MKIREMQDEIIRLKKEKNICILVHAYQSQDILEVADFVGDSFSLSEQAAKTDCDTVIMCGVRFMAETVKLLSPQKKVFLSTPDALCPMADQIDKEFVLQLKQKYPGYAVVAYINTTTSLKTVCDVCVTSASAVKIIKNMPEKDIIFVPDPNLGNYVQQQIPDKNFRMVSGGCPVHMRMSLEDVKAARAAHPDALLLVHPECQPAVTAEADYAGSTTGIMKFAKESSSKEFIIGTENSIVEHLRYECPDKRFYPLSKDCVCHNMHLTTLPEIYDIVTTGTGTEIILDEETLSKARHCIDEMLRLGK